MSSTGSTLQGLGESTPALARRALGVRESVARTLHSTALGRQILKARRILTATGPYVERKRGVALAGALGPATPIPRHLGYRFLDEREQAAANEAAEIIRTVYADTEQHLEEIHERQHGKFRIVFDLLSDDRIPQYAGLLEFALCDAVLATVVPYLATVPVLRRVGLGLSAYDHEEPAPRNSQLWHFDGEDSTQVKLYVSAWDIERRDGPLTFLPGPASARVVKALRRETGRHKSYPEIERYTDEEVLRHASPDEFVRMEGPAGTGAYVDTSRCLHFGSRVQRGGRRMVLGIVYQRYHLVRETPYNWFDASPYRDDSLRRLLLTPPRPCQPGYFFPNPVSAPGPDARGSAAVDDAY